MDKPKLTSNECLCIILQSAVKYNLPPEEVRRKIGEQMAKEGVFDLGEYLCEKAGFLFDK